MMTLEIPLKYRKQTMLYLCELQSLVKESCEILISDVWVWDYLHPKMNDIVALELVNSLRIYKRQIDELKYLLN